MIRALPVFGMLSVGSAALATTFTNISFSYGGAFTNASEIITSPYVGDTYTAGLSNAVLSGSKLGSTTWEFDFSADPGQKITGFQVEIDGTLSATQANSAKISLTSLDVLNTGLSGSPNVFDLAKNGGGPESKSLSNGSFSLFFPLSSSDFVLTTKGGIAQGQFSLGDTYQVLGGGTLTINQIIIHPQGVPEPSSLLGLGIPAAGLLWRKRRRAQSV